MATQNPADPLFDVRDQIVLVSGGTRGIGRAIVEGFLQRGATVVFTGRQADTVASAADALSPFAERAIGLVCDVANTGAIRSTVDQILEQWGRVDTLVNCAGINRRRPASEFDEQDYDAILDVNLRGAFFMSQAVGAAMARRGRGSQINIASLNNDRPLKHVAPYAMSKAAMGQMTRALALEWGPSGVRVNGVAPGFILTDLTTKLWSDPTMQQWAKTNTPQRRLGQPQDLVGATLFLASEASAFMTGQTLFVDGGFTAGWNWPIPEGGGQ